MSLRCHHRPAAQSDGDGSEAVCFAAMVAEAHAWEGTRFRTRAAAPEGHTACGHRRSRRSSSPLCNSLVRRRKKGLIPHYSGPQWLRLLRKCLVDENAPRKLTSETQIQNWGS